MKSDQNFEMEWKKCEFLHDGDLEVTCEELQELLDSATRSDLERYRCKIWTTFSHECDSKKCYLQPGDVHYLFPYSWYDYIPEGFPITTISGQKEAFKQAEIDSDVRFGCLAYGLSLIHISEPTRPY